MLLLRELPSVCDTGDVFFRSRCKGPTLTYGVLTRSDEFALTDADELLFSSCSDSLIDST